MHEPADSSPERLFGYDPRYVAMAASLGVAVLMLVGKLGAWVYTGSSAILADAAESIIHIVATGIAAYSLWFTAQPADQEHPYGHGKFAYFSAGFEGGLILAAGVGIIYLGIHALIHGPELQHLGVGLAVMGTLALINLALGAFLVITGKRHHAIVLEANGQHVLSDMWTSAAVVVGVALVHLTGRIWLDPVIAILAGANILRVAAGLLMQFFEGLMEKADPHDTAAILGCLQGAEREGLLSSFHQLRHRRVNDQVWIELHQLFPSHWSITRAHDNASVVEERLVGLFPRDHVYVTSHLEPADAEHELAHPGGHTGFPDALGREG